MRVAVVVLADTETHADRARVANALTTTYEFKEAGDEITLIFTGAGTKWVGELVDPDHRLHRAFEMVRDKVAGACRACAVSYRRQRRGTGQRRTAANGVPGPPEPPQPGGAGLSGDHLLVPRAFCETLTGSRDGVAARGKPPRYWARANSPYA